MILIGTCAYRRPEVFTAFLNNLPNYSCLVVGSENEAYSAWRFNEKKNDMYWVTFDNLPLGRKFNHMLQVAEKIKGWEYLFITGSDDVFSEGVFKRYEQLIKEGHEYIGLQDIYFMDLYSKDVRYCPGFHNDRAGEPHGAGRCISRRLLEKYEFTLWDDVINEGLDWSMTRKVKEPCKLVNLKQENLFACDMKSGVNIHSMWEYHTFPATEKPQDFGIKIYDSDYDIQSPPPVVTPAQSN